MCPFRTREPGAMLLPDFIVLKSPRGSRYALTCLFLTCGASEALGTQAVIGLRSLSVEFLRALWALWLEARSPGNKGGGGGRKFDL